MVSDNAHIEGCVKHKSLYSQISKMKPQLCFKKKTFLVM